MYSFKEVRFLILCVFLIVFIETRCFKITSRKDEKHDEIQDVARQEYLITHVENDDSRDLKHREKRHADHENDEYRRRHGDRERPRHHGRKRKRGRRRDNEESNSMLGLYLGLSVPAILLFFLALMILYVLTRKRCRIEFNSSNDEDERIRREEVIPPTTLIRGRREFIETPAFLLTNLKVTDINDVAVSIGENSEHETTSERTDDSEGSDTPKSREVAAQKSNGVQKSTTCSNEQRTLLSSMSSSYESSSSITQTYSTSYTNQSVQLCEHSTCDNCGQKVTSGEDHVSLSLSTQDGVENDQAEKKKSLEDECKEKENTNEKKVKHEDVFSVD